MDLSLRLKHRRVIWVRAAAAILLSFGSTGAHLPANTAFQAFHFPDHLVPEIDGDLSDWEVVAPSYIVPSAAFSDLVADASPTGAPADFSVRLMVGWSETQNKLFVAARVEDDLHQVDRQAGSAADRIFQDDDMEIFVDADHSGGQFADFSDLSQEEQLRRNGTAASHFVIAGPPPDEDFFVNFSAASWYALPDGPFTQAAFALDGSVGGPAVMSYEIALVPFDRVDIAASFLSVEHDLTVGETLGFNAEFGDFDSSSELLDAKWSLSGGQNGFRLSERFTDLLLMPLEPDLRPTGVTARSWARIKASFAQ